MSECMSAPLLFFPPRCVAYHERISASWPCRLRWNNEEWRCSAARKGSMYSNSAARTWDCVHHAASCTKARAPTVPVSKAEEATKMCVVCPTIALTVRGFGLTL